MIQFAHEILSCRQQQQQILPNPVIMDPPVMKNLFKADFLLVSTWRDGWTDGRTDRDTNDQTHGWTDRQVDGQMDGLRRGLPLSSIKTHYAIIGIFSALENAK